MTHTSTLTRRTTNQKPRQHFEPAPQSIGEAAQRDLYEARKHLHGVHEAILEHLGRDIEPNTIYIWAKKNHVWLGEEVEAIIKVTGGRHTLAYLRSLATHAAPVVEEDLQLKVAETLTSVAELNRQLAEDLSPDDDTPCEIDATERKRLHALVADLRAQVEHTESMIEAMK